jgi:hypothetical protein
VYKLEQYLDFTGRQGPFTPGAKIAIAVRPLSGETAVAIVDPLRGGRGDGFRFKGAGIAKRLRITPRVIRLRDAPGYVGMDKNRFGLEVRPYVREAPIGERGIAFDRLDLDAWVDNYFDRNARAPEPPKRSERELHDSVEDRSRAKSVEAWEKARADVRAAHRRKARDR